MPRTFGEDLRRVARLTIIGSITTVLAGAVPAMGQCEMSKLLAPEGQAEDRFGIDVAVSGDTAIVGSYPADEIGEAYIYRFDGTDWALDAVLAASDGHPGDRFGISVSISGNWAIVGADGADGQGAAYAYRYQDNQWVFRQKIQAADGDQGDSFGHAVAVDGAALVVGAHRDDDNGENSGSAYVFRRASLVWTEEAKLVPDDGFVSDWFGWSCDVEDNFLIVGSYWDDDQGTAAGSAYIYRYNGEIWGLRDKIIGTDVGPWDHFGCSVGIHGHVAVVGIRFEHERGVDPARDAGPGYAYVFRKDGPQWPQEVKLAASDGALDDYFGSAVDIWENTIVVASPKDDSSGVDSGSVYVFDYSDVSWSETAKLLAADGAMDDAFGNAVAVKSDLLVAGAVNDDDNGAYAGSARVFALADDDCNHNGICDAQDLQLGESADCNTNNVPDECDVVEVLYFGSGHLTPIGTGSPQEYVVPAPGDAGADMRLFFTAVADLDGPDRYIQISLNGVPVGDVFVEIGQACSVSPDEDHLVIDRDLVNQLVGGGQDATFTFVGMGGMDPEACGSENFIAVQIEHAVPGPLDVNHNGLIDECECPGDVNSDGYVDVEDLLELLADWGQSGVPADVSFDGIVNVVDLLTLLSSWGPC